MNSEPKFKTNSEYKVGDKFIDPDMIDFETEEVFILYQENNKYVARSNIDNEIWTHPNIYIQEAIEGLWPENWRI